MVQKTIAAKIGAAIFPLFTSLGGVPPDNLGLKQNELGDCPTSPSCLSTQSVSETHSLSPLTIHRTANFEEVIPDVVAAINSLPRVTIKKQTKDYVWAEFTSKIGWVDDVEVYADEKRYVLQFRSASRSGYFDLGSNLQHFDEIKNFLLTHYASTFTLY